MRKARKKVKKSLGENNFLNTVCKYLFFERERVFFRKKKLESKKKNHEKKSFLFGSFLSFLVFGLGFFGVHHVNGLYGDFFKFLPSTQSGSTEEVKENPIVHEKDITYILLAGRGGGNHDAPNLTDTMIVVGINKKSETITLFSLPRDLYVGYPDNGGYGRINGIYDRFVTKEREDFAMQKLITKVSEITGKNINFYVNIDFQSFIEVIDALGGVDVTLENNFVDYQYPDGKGGYKTFLLKKGTWTLDGEVALMYARSRHSTSDFDRSLRQQQIISALKEKVGSLGYFKDRKKISELFEIFQTYVQTNMSYSDMAKIALTIRKWENSKNLSFNLHGECFMTSPDCSAGGLVYNPERSLFGGASVLLPNTATPNTISSYEEIQLFSELIYEYPEIYIDNRIINIYNASQQRNLAKEFAQELYNYGFTLSEEQGENLKITPLPTTSGVYYTHLDKNDPTLLGLKKLLPNIPFEQISTPKYSSGGQIEIVLTDSNF